MASRKVRLDSDMDTHEAVAPLQWLRGIWGREVLRRRIQRLESRYAIVKQLLQAQAARMTAITDANARLSESVTQLETQNTEYVRLLQQWEESEKRIDPNAKCTVCGDRNGHLETEYFKKADGAQQVRCVNICHTCGNRFISADPVAGAERALELYVIPGKTSVAPQPEQARKV